jgi:hypothetical protein
MPNTFTLIASSTAGSGGTSAFNFTSIPSTYTDLCVKISSREESASNQELRMRVNGNTSSIYSTVEIRGTGSAVSSFTLSGTFAAAGRQNVSSSTANIFGNAEIYIPNYTNTSNNKSFSSDSVAENNGTAATASFVAGLISSTSAITSLSFFCESGDIAEFSTAYLYGIVKS